MKKYWSVSVRRGPSYVLPTGGRGRFPFNPKFQKFRVGTSKWNGPFQLGLTGIFGTSFEGGPLWLVWLSLSVGRTEMSSSIWQTCCPQYTLLYPPYKNNNQTHSGLGWVCATRMYHSIRHMEFPTFQTRTWIEWKVSRKSGLVIPYDMVILSQSSSREE